MATNDDIIYQQPAKVDKIEPVNGMLFPKSVSKYISELNKDEDNPYYRGFSKAVKEVDHESQVPEGHTRFVCISDTHNKHNEIIIPHGDVLLHAGDFTDMGEIEEVENFNRWMGTLPHKHKIVIAGNHELSFCTKMMKQATMAKTSNTKIKFEFLKDIPEKIWKDKKSQLSNCIYLEDEEVKVNGIRIYGSPWQPGLGFIGGFSLQRGESLLEKWDQIPAGIDILITHGPPAGKLDSVKQINKGCIELLNTVQLRVQPKYHIFGHIHEDPGYVTGMWTKYINASMIDRLREKRRKPIVLIFLIPKMPK